jgi:hypothetical protein
VNQPIRPESDIPGNGLYNEAQTKLMKHYESAAKLYCTLIGEDPLEKKFVPHPTIFGTQCTVERWHGYVDMLANMNLSMLALLRTQADRLPPEKPTNPAAAAPAVPA